MVSTEPTSPTVVYVDSEPDMNDPEKPGGNTGIPGIKRPAGGKTDQKGAK